MFDEIIVCCGREFHARELQDMLDPKKENIRVITYKQLTDYNAMRGYRTKRLTLLDRTSWARGATRREQDRLAEELFFLDNGKTVIVD